MQQRWTVHARRNREKYKRREERDVPEAMAASAFARDQVTGGERVLRASEADRHITYASCISNM